MWSIIGARGRARNQSNFEDTCWGPDRGIGGPNTFFRPRDDLNPTLTGRSSGQRSRWERIVYSLTCGAQNRSSAPTQRK
jgi:hypothetical protein